MTSVYNQRRRRKIRAEKRAERRRMRHTEGDWKFRSGYKLRPNAQRSYDE